ncbi:MAG: DNA translocase FtsK 4TM domain-containing protein [Planctomycetes bacterium]|nr:DNA translocase FtsK 4TM domain-containing protein [Planctomycetota bacterium]MBI3847045.1 DNA translocase FtsK 4TM domain-containing protein [Planctomycetota bacterium]
MGKTKSEEPSRKDVLVREACAILIAAITLFLGASLVSYRSEQPEANWCGWVGNVFGGALYDAVGLAAYAIVALIGTLGFFLFRKQPIEGGYAKACGAILLLVSLATSCTFLHLANLGGFVGIFFHRQLVMRFSQLGSLLVLLTFLAIALLLTTDWLPITAIGALIGRLRGLPWPSRDDDDDEPAKARATSRRVAVAKESETGADPKSATQNEKPKDKEKDKPSKEANPDLLAEDPDEIEAPPAEEKKSKKGRKKNDGPDRGPAIILEKPTLAPNSGDYELPPLGLLDEPKHPNKGEAEEEIRKRIPILEGTLRNFKIDADVVEIDRGPVITQYELELAAGIKVNRITNLSDDLAMALKAQTVRIVAPIPGKSTVGVEVPNAVRETVFLRELAETRPFREGLHALPLLLGKDASGTPLVEDLAQMPHLLIAGATGSGKSVCINAIIMSFLTSRTPADVQLILIDPKMVELSAFKDIPHLLTPVVTDMKKAPAILEWAVTKMEERYATLALVGVKNITGFNKLGADEIQKRVKAEDEDPTNFPTHLPYIVIVVDELADLMMVASKEIETAITRLAQKSRAVGIHIIFATQRPSVDVITGLIKANFPTRISFKVSQKVDSRTILDQNGADKLLGQGDLLYLPPRSAHLIRAQGAFVSDKEIKRVVDFVKEEAQPHFNEELERLEEAAAIDGVAPGEKDELYDQAVRCILESQRGSVSLLQRRLEIGYSRAARLVDIMAADGIVGAYKGSKAREVLMTLEDWEGNQAERAATAQSAMTNAGDGGDEEA